MVVQTKIRGKNNDWKHFFFTFWRDDVVLFKRTYNPTDSTCTKMRNVVWKPLSEFDNCILDVSKSNIFAISKNKAKLEEDAILFCSTFCLQYCSFYSNADTISLAEIILICFPCNALFNIFILSKNAKYARYIFLLNHKNFK